MNNQPLNCHIQPNTPFGAILTPQHPGQKIGELPVAALRALAQEHHLLVLRGFDSGFSEAEVLTRYAEQWGEIMMWPFGAVLDVKEHPDARDHIFDSSYVPLHWDGMYKPTIPEFQLFHCVAAPSQDEGGCTTFVDTTRLLANADEALLEQWLSVSITYRIKQVVHYGGEVCSPLVVQHPNGRGLIMRYNEPPTEGKNSSTSMRWNITACRNNSRNSSITPCSSTCTIRVTIMPTNGNRGTWWWRTTSRCCTAVRALPPVPRVICSACIFRATRCAPIWR